MPTKFRSATQHTSTNHLEVAAVIVNWNNRELTARCIESLLKNDYPALQIIVVDNGSNDGSAEFIKSRFDTVQVLANAENLGFAEGANQGMRIALEGAADHVVVLNNDTIADPHLISELVAAAQAHSNNATVIPKIYFQSDPQRLWFTVGRAKMGLGLFKNVAFREVDRGQYDNEAEMDFAVGCCLLFPRAVLEHVGLFDASLFMYCEDLDWSLRSRTLGHPLVLAPRARLWHQVSASGDRAPVQRRYLMTRNHIWVMRRHARPLAFFTFCLVFPFRSLLRIVKLLAHLDFRGVGAELRGSYAGFVGSAK